MTTPAISSVSGTVATGQTLTITGTNMADEDKTNWDNFFTDNTNASSFEGANPDADGWALPGGDPGGEYVTNVKLIGSKSIHFDLAGASSNCPVGNMYNSRYSVIELNGGGDTNDIYYRLYARWTLSGGAWPSSHIKMLDCQGSGGQYYFQPGPDDGGSPPSEMLCVHDGANHPVSFPKGGEIEQSRWYCFETHWRSSGSRVYQAWIDGTLVYDVVPAGNPSLSYVLFGLINLCGTNSSFNMSHHMDGMAYSSSRVRPYSMVEIGDGPVYSSSTKVYQAPTTLSDTSNVITCDLTGLGAGPTYYVWVTNNRGERSAYSAIGGSDTTAPTLSNPQDGTPTSNGTTNASVDTANDANGVLYWAVVTSGGSCTDAQLKAGSGGNIVSGVAGNQVVATTGTLLVTSITGLSAATTYQIKFLHRDASGNDSSQASVSLTTTAADVTAPVLSSPSAGTVNSNGSENASVSTDEGNGTLYWAVVTNGGSCTAAQLKAGSGGNIVSGIASNQPVVATGTQTISDIVGLSHTTTYQIKYLHRDAAGNDSSPASVNLTTTTPALNNVFFSEAFENSNFSARGWYDGDADGVLTPFIDTSVFSPNFGSAGALRLRWNAGETSPFTPRRKLFTPSDRVYIRFDMKLGTAGVPWQGSGEAYHPHWIILLTDSNGDYDGLAWNFLTTYVEMGALVTAGTPLYPRFALQDGARINSGQLGVNLLGSATTHAIAGGNGSQASADLVDYYSIGGGLYTNASFWDSASANLSNNTWHTIEVYLQMNSIDGGIPQADGVLWYKVDGTKCIDRTDMRFRTAQYATQKWNQFVLAPYIEPGAGSPITQDAWIDNLLVADQPGGGLIHKAQHHYRMMQS